jgi:ribosomal protein S21
MAVIVNDNMSIDQALRMLWREANREDIINTLKDLRYFIKRTFKLHEKKRAWQKTKSRRARRKRQFRNKGYIAG